MQGSPATRLEQQTPEALGAFHKAEVEKWWPIIKGAHHELIHLYAVVRIAVVGVGV